MQLPDNDPGFKATQAAIEHIKNSLAQAQSPDAIGIRVGVKKAGCSGWEYILEYAYPGSLSDLDYDFELNDGLHVIVDQETYLKFFKGGTVLDYRREGLNDGFKFDNPNVANQCGCGESFTLK